MKKKILLVVLAITLIFSLCGCSPTIRLSDIYVNNAELTKYDGARLEGELPSGFSVAYNYMGTGGSYVVSDSPFFLSHSWVVVKKNKDYGVYDYKNKSFVMGSETELYDAIRKNENFIIGKNNAGEVMLRNCKTGLVQKIINNLSSLNDIKILDAESNVFLYRNNETYEIYDADGYISQFNIRLNNSYADKIYCHDDYIIQSDSTSSYAAKNVAIYKIPSERESVDNGVKMLGEVFTGTSIYPSYLGGGKFYIFMQDSAGENDFDYRMDGRTYKGLVKIYNAITDKIEKEYKDDKYYRTILSDETEKKLNQYQDVQLSFNEVVKDGYKLVVDAIIINSDKTAEKDQFVLDKDNNVVLSLSGKRGSDMKLNVGSVEGFSPLMLLFIDGKGFAPNMQMGNIRLLNIDGTTAFEKHDGLYGNLYYNNGALVCQKQLSINLITKENNLYGAFDMNGKEIVPFKYDYITPFIDGFALAYDKYILYKATPESEAEEILYHGIYFQNGKWYKPSGEAFPDKYDPAKEKAITYKVYKIDKNGNQSEITDIARTKNNRLVFKVGAYVNKNADGTYNVKNINGEKLFGEDFTDVVIHKPTLNDVTICGTRNDKVYIYTLTSSTRGIPEARTIHDVIVPSVIVGSLLLASVIMIVVIKVKKPSNAK